MTEDKPKKNKGLRILFYLAVVVGVLFLLALGASEIIIRRCTAPEPTLTGKPPAILQQRLQRKKGRTTLGRSWIAKRRGLWTMYLEGDPFTIGYASGRLSSELLKKQENELLATVKKQIPNSLILRVVRTLVAYHNCSLHKHIPAEYKMEILGLSRGAPHQHTYLGPPYNKFLNYHAAHDISHMVMDNPLVGRSGCTALAAWDHWTQQGHLLAGRNFDFEAGRSFDKHKIVTFFRPQKGIPFVSVSWAGFLGVVSGANEKGIALVLNAGHASGGKGLGTPVSLVARRALQYASNLSQAIKLLCKPPVFVSESFLVGSRKKGRFVVVERSPKLCKVRQAKDKHLIVANHFLHPAFAQDKVAQKYKKTGTSLPRYARMKELVEQAKGRLSPPKIARILRDQRGPKGQNVGHGNRSTLNPLIATHSVIIDLTAMKLWVSTAPHQLGEFVAFDLRHFARPLPQDRIPPDPYLRSGYPTYRKFLKGLKALRPLLQKRKHKEALHQALKLEKLNPHYYAILALIGELYAAVRQPQKAKKYLQRALAARPAFQGEKKRIRSLLHKIEAHPPTPPKSPKTRPRPRPTRRPPSDPASPLKDFAPPLPTFHPKHFTPPASRPTAPDQRTHPKPPQAPQSNPTRKGPTSHPTSRP